MCRTSSKLFRVLTYDGKGQGEGPRPNHAHHFSELVADLQNLLMSLKIDKSFFLGISQGARIALKFAELAPNQVEAVIAADIPTSPALSSGWI